MRSASTLWHLRVAKSPAALASQRLHEAAKVIATAMAGTDSLDVAETMAFLTLFADH